jgi:hypothetical protein
MMVLKPTPRQAVLLQERVKESINSNRLSKNEEEIMRKLNVNIEKYLKEKA